MSARTCNFTLTPHATYAWEFCPKRKQVDGNRGGRDAGTLDDEGERLWERVTIQRSETLRSRATCRKAWCVGVRDDLPVKRTDAVTESGISSLRSIGAIGRADTVCHT